MVAEVVSLVRFTIPSIASIPIHSRKQKHNTTWNISYAIDNALQLI